MKTRIHGDMCPIDYGATRDFFEGRGRKYNEAHPYTSVCYQDDNPDLAARRDTHEKNKVLPLLGVGAETRVLDVGCGVGRWADALAPLCAAYLGLDFSESLLEVARGRTHEAWANRVRFQHKAMQEMVGASPADFSVAPPFSCCLLSGILVYLNDQDVAASLDALTGFLASSCTVYIREPVGTQERLTLNGHYSEDLNARYSAIYRTVPDYQAFLAASLVPAGFRIREEGFLLPPDLANRQGTTQYYFLLTR